VQNRDLLKESNEQSYEQIDTHYMLFNTYMKLLRTYEKLLFTDGKLQRLVRTCCNKAWQANMDIQFVLDPYACAVYILSYITKGQRGMSKLLRKACEEAK
jgi:hypothetical protein